MVTDRCVRAARHVTRTPRRASPLPTPHADRPILTLSRVRSLSTTGLCIILAVAYPVRAPASARTQRAARRARFTTLC